ncbi:hypothetical protein LZ31DRAFT_561119 [Colletotrichum somersetense]|nr:hypothetical protein LZ31DRAFT_561119 [Colletotrichum somersetense]
MASVCITQRCGLCSFSLHHGEDIKAASEDGQLSEQLPNDPAMMAKHIPCVGACSHSGGQATGCHVECVNQVPIERLPALLKLTTPNYEPTPSECARRAAWLHRKSASVLSRTLGILSPELHYQITGYCLRSFAVEYAKAILTLHDTPTNPTTLCLSVTDEIWAHRANFEGINYLSSLSNSADKYHAELIFKPDPKRSVEIIYVAENHLGVEQMIFCTCSDRPEINKSQDLWWRMVHVETSTRLVVQRDSLKIRSVAFEEKQTTSPLTLWATPPLKPVRYVQLEHSPQATRMSSLLLNKPCVVGYAFYWYLRIKSMHAVTCEEDFSFYHGNNNGIWMYLPLHEGEKIAEVWRLGETKWNMALIFKTTRGRTVIVGPPLGMLSTTPPSLLALPCQQTSSHLFFEASRIGVRNIAFDSPEPKKPLDYTITLPKPSNIPGSDYFYSTATLGGVNEITPCQARINGQTKVIGLLLRYSDGYRACLGQIRLDCLSTSLQVGSNWSMWLVFSKDEHGCFVAGLTLSRPEKDKLPCSLEVCDLDDLDWWFYLQDCKVHRRR